MKDKKSLTQSILDNIIVKGKNDVKLDLDIYIKVPTNHPKINEIIKLLNYDKYEKCEYLQKDKTEIKNNVNLEDDKKIVVTLSDLLSLKNKKILLSKNSIITPMAKDYIKQKNIEIVYIN